MLRKVLYLGFLIISNAGCYRVVEEGRVVAYYTPIWDTKGKRIYFIKRVKLWRTVVPSKPFAKEETQYKWEYYLMKCDENGENLETLRVIFKQDEYDGWGDTVFLAYLGDISPSGEILGVRIGDDRGILLLDTIGESEELIFPWGRKPYWAYNYTKIIFQGVETHPGIWMVNRDGTGLQKILDEGEIEAYSDLNKKLVFSTNYGKTLCIYSLTGESVDTIIANFEELVPGITFSIGADWNKKGDTLIWIETPCNYTGLVDDTLALWIWSEDNDSIIRVFIENDELAKKVVGADLRWQSWGEYLIFTDDLNIWRVKKNGTELKKIVTGLYEENGRR